MVLWQSREPEANNQTGRCISPLSVRFQLESADRVANPAIPGLLSAMAQNSGRLPSDHRKKFLNTRIKYSTDRRRKKSVSLRLCSNSLYQKFLTFGSPAATRSARVPHRKMFSTFLILRELVFFLLIRMRTFFCGFLPSTIRAGGGTTMRTRFCENYFLGRKRISQHLGSDFPRAGGVWGGMRAGNQSRPHHL